MARVRLIRCRKARRARSAVRGAASVVAVPTLRGPDKSQQLSKTSRMLSTLVVLSFRPSNSFVWLMNRGCCCCRDREMVNDDVTCCSTRSSVMTCACTCLCGCFRNREGFWGTGTHCMVHACPCGCGNQKAKRQPRSRKRADSSTQMCVNVRNEHRLCKTC